MATQINYKINKSLEKKLRVSVAELKASENEFLRCIFANSELSPDPVALKMYAARHSFVTYIHN